MSEALLEIMKPLIEPIILKRENEKWQQGIKNAIDILRRLGHNENEIEIEIMEQYGLTTEEVKEHMSR